MVKNTRILEPNERGPGAGVGQDSQQELGDIKQNSRARGVTSVTWDWEERLRQEDYEFQAMLWHRVRSYLKKQPEWDSRQLPWKETKVLLAPVSSTLAQQGKKVHKENLSPWTGTGNTETISWWPEARALACSGHSSGLLCR